VANEDKATRYQRLRRRATVAGVGSTGLVLTLAHLAGPPGFAVAEDGAGLFAQLTALTAGTAGLLTIGMAGLFPSAFYRDALLTRRYGVLRERPAAWLKDWVRRAAVTVVLGSVAVAGCALLRLAVPAWWWLAAGVLAGVAPFAIAGLIQAATRQVPSGTPLQRRELRDRLTRLAAQAGLPELGLYQTNIGERTRLAQAAVVTVGGQRHVLLSDTLLADHSDDEVEVVVAHELAHVVRHDVITSQAVFAVSVAVTLFGVDVLLWRLAPGTAFVSPTHVPVALLAAGCGLLLLRPIALAVSRGQERVADRYAVTLTGGSDALASVVRRIAANHLAEPSPSRITVWLFHSHPSASDRILAANRPSQPAHRSSAR